MNLSSLRKSLLGARKIHLILFIIIAALAVGLRAHNYWIVPLSDETADELAWTWLGASLLVEGQPTSWSLYSQYQDGYIYKKNIIKAPLVRPVVDHPPLFSLIPGAMHAATAEWETIPSRKVIRFPMLFLGCLNVVLLYFVARAFFDTDWALVAMTIYATAPTFVYASRLVVAENLLITWTLLCILGVVGWLQHTNSRNKYVAALVAISIAAVLTKISGIVIPITLIGFAVVVRSPAMLKVSLCAFGLSILSLLLYMTAIDLPLFLSVQFSQADRLLGLTTIFSRFLIHPTVAKMVFYDGWVLLGLAAALVQIANFIQSEHKQSQLQLFVHLLFLLNGAFILTTVEEFSFHGWYSYVLFPFFILAIVELFKKIYAGNVLLMASVWVIFLATANTVFTQLHIRDSLTNFQIRALYAIGFLPLLGQALSSKYAKKLTLYLAVIMLIANCISVLTITELSVRENNNFYYQMLPHNDIR